MLVLDRKIHEGFWIENRIFVKVLGIGRRRIKIGIEAPTDVKIVRDELWSRPAGQGPNGRGLPAADEQADSGETFRPVRRGN